MNSIPNNSIIRPMLRRDLREVVAIERKTHSPPWGKETLLAEIGNPCTYAFVATHEHRFGGYLVFWMIRDEVHLLALSTNPEFRRCGVGKRLVSFLICFSRYHGVQWIGLEVRKSNRAALALYRSFGFRRQSVRKRYYQNPQEDALVMEWELGREAA
jgi:ribosomal-protein-alanine N-acetyltransferase